MIATKMRQALEKVELQQWVGTLFNLDLSKSLPLTLSHSLLFPFQSPPSFFYLSTLLSVRHCVSGIEQNPQQGRQMCALGSCHHSPQNSVTSCFFHKPMCE